MNTAQLVELIRVEVRNAIREELAEVIQEAVKIASTPEAEVNSKPANTVPKPVLPVEGRRRPIADLLEETKLSFTAADARSFVAPSQRDVFTSDFQSRPATALANKLGMTAPENLPGIDINQLPFIKKAKQVLDMSIEKDKQRHT